MKPVQKSAAVAAELERLRVKHKGILKPVVVVKAAENPKSPLHPCFCWDDTVAAQRYRLTQAKDLIRIQVQIIPNTDDSPRRIYVALEQDKGGYRAVVDVMVSRPLRESLVAQALAEFRIWEGKWKDVRELSEIFAAAEKTRKST